MRRKIYAQYKDLQNRLARVENQLDRVNIRLDRIENRMDRLEVRMEMRMDNLEKKSTPCTTKLNRRRTTGKLPQFQRSELPSP